MTIKPKRLDLCVMDMRGFSRAYAKEVILAGLVLVDGKAVTKPGSFVFGDNIQIMAPDMPYVSRGGQKLAKALEFFNIDLKGLVCLDAGASTGGFTDCMLKSGAAFVHAVDVGKGQMAGVLLDDPRVALYENTDIREFCPDTKVDFVACDLSFISLAKVLPSLANLVKPGGGLICLLKPQFETDGKFLNKRGIVKTKMAEEAKEAAFLSFTKGLKNSGFCLIGSIESPILGGGGNKEYLAYAKLEG